MRSTRYNAESSLACNQPASQRACLDPRRIPPLAAALFVLLELSEKAPFDHLDRKLPSHQAACPALHPSSTSSSRTSFTNSPTSSSR